MATVLSIGKCLDLLEAVAANDGGVGTRELSRKLGINVTTVHNIARTLASRGYLRQDPQTRRFTPGMRLMLLGRGRNLNRELSDIAMPFVRQAVEITGETAMLCTMEQGRAVRMIQIASPQALCVREHEDLGDHAYCTATGKMLLATLSESGIRAFLEQTPLVKHTEHTLADPAELIGDLRKTRLRGYATVVDEYCEGVSAVAVLVRDPWGAPAAAIGVSAPTQRFALLERTRAIAALQELSAQISFAWGKADRPADVTQRSSAAPTELEKIPATDL